MRTKLILLLISIWVLPGIIYAADPVKGNGHITTVKTEVEDYNEIRINGVMDFHYEQSETSSALEITIDENLRQYVRAEVKNRVLTIEFKRGTKVEQVTKFIVKGHSKWLKEARMSGNANFIVERSMECDELVLRANANCLVQLKAPVKVGQMEMKVTGSANMVVDTLLTERIKCDMDGSGSVHLKQGKAQEGNYNLTGSGDLHASGFEIEKLTCKLTGSGLAEIYATEYLKTNVIGSGEIRYKGVPPEHQTIIGKGKITFIE